MDYFSHKIINFRQKGHEMFDMEIKINLFLLQKSTKMSTNDLDHSKTRLSVTVTLLTIYSREYCLLISIARASIFAHFLILKQQSIHGV